VPQITDSGHLFIRLYLDRHVKPQLAVDLRGRGYDVLTTQEAGLDTATDEDQLVFASRENRAILTFDISHFANLHRQWTEADRRHAGIVVSKQLGSREYGVLLSRVRRMLDRLSADEVRGALVPLEQFKR
jgi:predicted nuclease of predicted toxin-antitoxin system